MSSLTLTAAFIASSPASSTSSCWRLSSSSTGWILSPSRRDSCRSLSYMYAYTLYLFFDFAGYSAFAVGFSYLLGIRTPENFDRPFLARDIRDFWNRWHMSLSFWFRDHIYNRFLFTALKGRWFRSPQLASSAGYLLTMGLMGLWHGTALHFLAYGLYHGVLLAVTSTLDRRFKSNRLINSPDWSLARCFHLSDLSPRGVRPPHLLRPFVLTSTRLRCPSG